MSPPTDQPETAPALQLPAYGLALEQKMAHARHESTSLPSPASESPPRPAIHEEAPNKRPGHSPGPDARRSKNLLIARIAGAILISASAPAGFHLWIASGAVMQNPVEAVLISQTRAASSASEATALSPLPETSTPQAASPVALPKAIPARHDPEESGASSSHTPPGIEKSALNPHLADDARDAYDAYQAGKLEDAFQRYGDALTRTPHNADILNALGLISLRLGLRNDAERYWRQSTQLDPANATANAHLSTLHAGSGQSGSELFLRAQLVEQPGSSSLLFALGSLYAQQDRWAEAQQMFFEAHTHDPESPDTAYNLAVALDHLDQAEAAARFYLLAHTASATHPSGFDAGHAVRRARTLLARTTPNP